MEETNEYRCGPDRPLFDGDYAEWDAMSQVVASWTGDASVYPYVTVVCPHCGAENIHNDSDAGADGHTECTLLPNNVYADLYLYDCPGYIYLCTATRLAMNMVVRV